jgi:hypothetical protein
VPPAPAVAILAPAWSVTWTTTGLSLASLLSRRPPVRSDRCRPCATGRHWAPFGYRGTSSLWASAAAGEHAGLLAAARIRASGFSSGSPCGLKQVNSETFAFWAASSRSSAGLPHSQNISGVSRVSSSVELIRPPKITTATGCSTSLPGASAESSSGSRAKAATSAVISTGVRRSSEPRTIMAGRSARPRRRTG